MKQLSHNNPPSVILCHPGIAELLFTVGEYLLNVRLWAVLRLLEDEASAEEVDKTFFGVLVLQPLFFFLCR